MSISSVSSANVARLYTPPVQQYQPPAQAPQSASAKDTVTISKQAQQLASDGDTLAQEAVERGAEKASEKARGKA